ncbi:proline/glycine betaine transporter [Klebsiella pneumoniae subsp. ozaenae]|uniref:Proline/glycine betaine transporter n=1 Tax=Klebsiella pneumoniae subsp. ozaenae TaxID=574 RepID=A0A378B5T9_KLEPO|nr:proline/glycine betaine transporter [Klebsiella pneumoniae subsp. ozaenae]
MFPTHIRFSALASAFNISVLIAGLTPTLAAWLVETTQKPDDAGVLPDGYRGGGYGDGPVDERDG